MKLYHFTSIDSFNKIWVSKQIRFSDNFYTNDLLERRKLQPYVKKIYSTNRYKNKFEALEALNRAYTNELRQYKQVSFSKDHYDENGALCMYGWQSPLMWGQYAHNDKGVCIELDLERLSINNILADNVEYVNVIPCLYTENGCIIINKTLIKKYVLDNLHNIFFVKHKHWEHENEYRMIKRTKRDHYISIDDAISAVYVFDINDINTKVVYKLIQNEVPLYALWVRKEDDINIERILVQDYIDSRNYKLRPSINYHFVKSNN